MYGMHVTLAAGAGFPSQGEQGPCSLVSSPRAPLSGGSEAEKHEQTAFKTQVWREKPGALVGRSWELKGTASLIKRDLQ